MNALTVFPVVVDRAFKWLVFLTLGVVLTLFLLILMARLVEFKGTPEDPEVFTVRPIEIFENPPVVEEKFKEIEPPVEVTPPPVNPITPHTENFDRSDVGIIEFQPPVAVGPDKFGVDFDTGAPVKRVSASPVYPRRALSRGIEGFVDVQYFVSPVGFTESASIIRSEPEGYFEKSAMQAVERWKFQPKENTNVEAYGPIVERIRFTIAK